MITEFRKYAKLIDDIIVDFLTDIKSLRYQLVLAGFALNIYFFKHGADTKIMLASVGLLTAIYAMYFASKHHQAVMENQNKSQDDADDVSTDEHEEKAGDANE